MSFSHLPLPPAQEADQVEVPLKSLDGKGVHMCSIDILDPLSVVDYLFNVVQIEISQTDVETYWKHYRSVGSAWAVNHPASNFHVPISLYGDSCKIRTGEKMLGIFCSFPLWRPKSIRCSRFLLVALREEQLHGRATLDCIYRYIVWRINLLFAGKWPRCSINGGELPPDKAQRGGQFVVHDGRQFAITELRGDWVFHKQVLSFKSSWKGGTIFPVCYRCEARSHEPHLYYEVGPNASSWNTEYDLYSFLAAQMPSQPSS